MSRVTLAGAPVSWGVDFADDPANPSPSAVLDGIRAVGLRWLELGPPGFLGDRAGALEAHGLAGVGTFVFEPFHAGAAHREIRAAVDRALDCIDALGGRLLVLIDRPCAARAATAGRRGDARGLSFRQWSAMIDAVRRAAARAQDAGVRAVFHAHAGSHVEFVDELERLLDDIAVDELGLCLDTGHLLYCGEDPLRTLERFAGRVEHLHVKDVRPDRLADAHAASRDFWSAMASGVFCPAGDGSLSLPELGRTLDAIGYRGYATIEQDRRPRSPGSPADDLRRSVDRLLRAGVGTLDDRAGA